MEKRESKYIANAITDMLEHDVEIQIVKVGKWNYFSKDELGAKSIFVYTAHGPTEWIPNFIHEYCHFLQWKENMFQSSIWENSAIALDEIVNDLNTFVSQKKINLHIRRVRTFELDCEKRTVEQIKKHKLKINIKEYIKKANTYLFSHNFISLGKSELYKDTIHREDGLWQLMPSYFLSRYDRLPKKFLELAIKLYEQKQK